MADFVTADDVKIIQRGLLDGDPDYGASSQGGRITSRGEMAKTIARTRAGETCLLEDVSPVV